MDRESLNRSVRKRPEKITLVVGSRKFYLNRHALVQGSPYFRAMLEGNFVESHTNRVVLKSVSDPHVFQAFLDYAFKEKQSFLRHAPHLASALDLADMYCQDNVAGRVRKDLLRNWMDAADMRHVVDIAARLDVKDRILRVFFRRVSRAFFAYGFQLSTGRLNQKQRQDCLKELTCSIPFLLSFFEMEESYWLCFSDPRGLNNCFAKGVMRWVHDEKIWEEDVVHVVRRLRLDYFQESVFNDLIRSLPNAASSAPYKKQLELNYFGVRGRIKDAISQIVFGRVDPELVIFSFNLKNWQWEQMLTCRDVSLSDRDYTPFESGRSLCFSLLPFCQSFFVGIDHVDAEGRFDFFRCMFNFRCHVIPPSPHPYQGVAVYRNNVLQKGNMYCTGKGSHAGSEYDMLVLSCDSDMNFSVVCRVKRLKKVHACQVVRVGNVVHGFVCHKPDGEGTRVSHFDVNVSPESTRETVVISNLQPLFTDVPVKFRVVAAALTSFGIVLLFLCNKYFCLTRYDLKLKDMEILGFLPQCQFVNPEGSLVTKVPGIKSLYYLSGNIQDSKFAIS